MLAAGRSRSEAVVITAVTLLFGGCNGGSPPAPASCAAIPLLTPGTTVSPQWPTTTGKVMLSGTLSGPTLVLPKGAVISVDAPLTIVADKDISIDGQIQIPNMPKGTPGPGLMIVSLHGTVTLSDGSFVGCGGSGKGDGGAVTISGVVLELHGTIYGNDGGVGDDVPSPIAPTASATGGNGGQGGSLLMCAVEGIKVGSKVRINPGSVLIAAGNGGTGGKAVAVESGGTSSKGGNGGGGGDVTFSGPNAGTKVPVIIDNDPAGGSGEKGGATSANSNARRDGGGNAVAVGGDGGAGGTVKFVGVVVTLGPAATVAAGNGADGLKATATGGDGSSPLFGNGNSGGDATATGGHGGAAGATPVIPLPNGTTKGSPGRDGSGADATAIPGNGSAAATGWFGGSKGGASGKGTAVGGPNGATVAATAVRPTGPVAATGPAGANGVPVTAMGRP